MRKPHEMTIDRALLLYLLHLAESFGSAQDRPFDCAQDRPHGLMSDVKLQQLAFLCELQLFGKGLKGLHFEFFRYAYGAFSKDLDNDLLSLRRKEHIENFSLTDKAEEVLKILPEAAAGIEANQRVIEILQAVATTYAPQDGAAITQSVEAVEISASEQPELKLAIRDISFHSTLLVPSRIEAPSEFSLSPRMAARLNAAMGY
ncbi:MAG: hypothetical protein HZA21_00240 [Nitrospirae bacterium]|nr:hypothetical protein [Nitrospirota bacterium]